MKNIRAVHIKNFIVLMFLSSIAVLALSQMALAHGGTKEEEASEKLVEITIAPGENYHIEIEAETLDGKRIPELGISVVATNNATGEKTETILHGMFGGNYHYGSNMALPEGEYTFSFHIDPPTFMRDGSTAGSWTEPVDADVVFSTVENPEDEYETVIKTTDDMVIVFVAEPVQRMWAFPEAMESMGHMMDGADGADGADEALHDDGDTHEDEEMREVMIVMHDNAGEAAGEAAGGLLLAILALIAGVLLGFGARKSQRSVQQTVSEVSE